MSKGPSRATLVTGASSGIGRAIALRLASEGWPVYAAARDTRPLADLESVGCQLLELDVTEASARDHAIAQIEAEHGAVGALVNNAGYGQQGPFEETPLAAFRNQFETNVFSVVGLCQRALPAMRAQRWGRILNLSSMGGRLSFPGGAAYHGSKYALEAISDVLRFEVAGFGIRVVVLQPGPTSTAFGARSLRSLEDLVPTDDGAYDALRAGIRTALASTFETEPPSRNADSDTGIATPQEVAEVAWQALSSEDPKPRQVVGAAGEQMVALKESGTERDWDRFVAGLYPAPGIERNETPDTPRQD